MPANEPILILSRSRNEPTTEAVIDWLEALGARFYRLNAEDVEYPPRFQLRIDGAGEVPALTFGDRFTGEARTLDLPGVRSVWYRRWTLLRQYNYRFMERFTEDHRLQGEVVRYMHREIEAVSQAVFGALGGARWLSRPETARPNKLHVLSWAAALGIEVPATIVATTREQLKDFLRLHPQAITKNSGRSPLSLDLEESDIASYTSRVDAALVERLPEAFFPSLVQELVPKQYEVRVFFLDGACYAMAIFSQDNPETELDFRRYPADRPNRTVPYRLPADLKERLLALAGELELETGSIDLIRAADGRYVFLEINPVGQFGMVSAPCNYYLEEKVARRLADDARAE